MTATTGDMSLTSSSANMTLESTSGNITLNANGTNSQITLVSNSNLSLTGNSDVSFNSSLGNMDLLANGTNSVISINSKSDANIRAVNGRLSIDAASNNVYVNANGDNSNINLSAGSEINLTATTGEISLNSQSSTLSLNARDNLSINSSNGNISIDASRNVTLNCSTFTLTTDTENKVLNNYNLTVASGDLGLSSSSGGVNISASGDATAGDIVLTSDESDITMNANGAASNISLLSHGTAENAITLNSYSGGVDIDAAAGKDVNIAGGQVALVSKTDEANAISLTTNVGTSETITVTNTQGDGESAIAISASAGGVDIDAAAGKDVNIAGGQVALVSKTDEAQAISLTTDVGTSETITVTNTQGEGESAIAISASAGGVDIDAAAGKDVNIAGGQVALASKTNEAQAISLTTNVGTSETITVTNTLGTNESAIAIAASAGGVDIDAASGKDVNISGGQVTLASKTDEAEAISLTTNVGTSETITVTNTQGTSESAIAISSSAGGVDIDAAAGKDVNIAGGQVALVSKTDEAEAISLTTNVGSSETITVTNTQGTDNAAIALTSTVGGITMKVADEKDLTLGNADGDAYFKVAASETAGNEDLRIVNTNGTDAAAIEVTASAGGIDINAQSNIAMDAVGTIDLSSNSTMSLSSNATSANAITITASSGGVNMSSVGAIKINATNSSGNTDGKLKLISENTMQLTSESDATLTANGVDSVLTLRATAGGSSQGVNIESQGTGAEAITMEAVSGGVELSSFSKFKIINFGNDSSGNSIPDGGILLESAFNSGDAISLRALNGGLDVEVDSTISLNTASSDITLNAESGNVKLYSSSTDSDSITIKAHSGGINMQSVGAIKINATNTSGQTDGKLILKSDNTMNIISQKDMTQTANGYDSVLTLRATGGGPSQKVNVESQGTGAEAITVNAVAGGVEMSSYNKFKIINFGNDACGNDVGDGGILLESSYNSGDAIHLAAKSGGIDMDADDNVSVNANSGNISMNSASGNIDLDAKTDILLDASRNIALRAIDGTISLHCNKFQLVASENDDGGDSGTGGFTSQNLTLTSTSGDLTLLSKSGGLDANIRDGIAIDTSNGSVVVNAMRDANADTPAGGQITLNTDISAQNAFTINTIGSEGGGGLDIRTSTFPTRIYKDDDADASSDTSGSLVTEGGILVKKSVISFGGFDNMSDRRLKTNIKQFENAIPILKKIRPVTFNWKKNMVGLEHGRSELGVIAQEVERAIPNYLVHDRGDGSYKTVDYTRFCPLLLAGIREQQTQMELMTKQIDVLQKALKVQKKEKTTKTPKEKTTKTKTSTSKTKTSKTKSSKSSETKE